MIDPIDPKAYPDIRMGEGAARQYLEGTVTAAGITRAALRIDRSHQESARRKLERLDYELWERTAHEPTTLTARLLFSRLQEEAHGLIKREWLDRRARDLHRAQYGEASVSPEALDPLYTQAGDEWVAFCADLEPYGWYAVADPFVAEVDMSRIREEMGLPPISDEQP